MILARSQESGARSQEPGDSANERDCGDGFESGDREGQ